MPPSPDDLPRAPSGRIPRWVIDEAAGAPPEQAEWRASVTPIATYRRRRRHGSRAATTVIVVVVALGASWWLTDGTHLPGGVTAVLSHLPAAAGHVPAPTAEAVALADAAHLSAEGRAIFYATEPAVLDAKAFAGRCTHLSETEVRGEGAVGCYIGGANRIFVYEPADPRLRGYVVETTAHETLHAAWATLPAAQRDRLIRPLEAAVAPLPADSTLRKELAESVGTHVENRPTEMFAYVGTLLWRNGGLDPELETVYGRFLTDRPALIAVHTAAEALLDEMNATIQAASNALAVSVGTAAHERAQQAADAASVAYYQQVYEAKAAQVAAMRPAERERLRLSWTWWDGTDLPMAPAEQTLAVAAALLTRDQADLSQRLTTVTAAEAAAAAERVRIQALIDDLQGLQTELDPVAAAAG
ncbi:MAG: hypothetical protein ACOH17_09685 [Cellulomonas sp.]